MKKHIAPVPLDKASRLLNHGPATLVSARHAGTDNVMAVSWACMLDYAPPKVTVVLGQGAKTRELIEKSGTFVLQIPTAAQLRLTYDVGHISLADDPEKLKKSGVTLFEMDAHDLPFVAGCAAWLACKVIPEAHNQETYDLFMAEVIAAWSDTRAFKDGRWHFEKAGSGWRSLHYVAGGRFYAIGEALDTAEGMPE
ncbi:flavin reductase family protein [Oxalobacter sp. OttesenSCG-928-P03]|nr:flavin reductase family protein [Oxalobacter sp. OttesenSCG-928-P03]